MKSNDDLCINVTRTPTIKTMNKTKIHFKWYDDIHLFLLAVRMCTLVSFICVFVCIVGGGGNKNATEEYFNSNRFDGKQNECAIWSMSKVLLRAVFCSKYGKHIYKKLYRECAWKRKWKWEIKKEESTRNIPSHSETAFMQRASFIFIVLCLAIRQTHHDISRPMCATVEFGLWSSFFCHNTQKSLAKLAQAIFMIQY